jgi:hypothetical protein
VLKLNDITINKQLSGSIGLCFKVRNVSYRHPLGYMLKDPTHIQAHLVFANTQSPNKKPKELEFCQRSTETKY